MISSLGRTARLQAEVLLPLGATFFFLVVTLVPASPGFLRPGSWAAVGLAAANLVLAACVRLPSHWGLVLPSAVAAAAMGLVLADADPSKDIGQLLVWVPALGVFGALLRFGWSLAVTGWGILSLLLATAASGVLGRSPALVVSTALACVVAGLVMGGFIRWGHRRIFFDPLTWLANRAGLTQTAEPMIVDARNHGRDAVLVLLDIDRFREINDALGHEAGDDLLRMVADRLRAVVPTPAYLGRLGADEFALLFIGAPAAFGTAEDERLRTLGASVLEQIEGRYRVRDVEIEVEAKAGLAVAPRDGDSMNALLACANTALAHVKRDGERVGLWDAGLAGVRPWELGLHAELRAAVARGELVLFYQPLQAAPTGRIVGAEALLRWRHPRRGLLPPGSFLPMAERSTLILDLTEWVLHEALRQCAEWASAGLHIPVSVNLSARMLVFDNLPALVKNSLAAHGLPPDVLTLEITESALVTQPTRAAAMLRGLRTMGVKLALDDFGTGYSSMEILKALPFDEVKIDKSFVTDARGSLPDAAIVRSVLDLGHRLGLRVVGEGVEDARTLRMMAELGCDILQGDVISPAVPADRLSEMLTGDGNLVLAAPPAAPWIKPWAAAAESPAQAGKRGEPGRAAGDGAPGDRASDVRAAAPEKADRGTREAAGEKTAKEKTAKEEGAGKEAAKEAVSGAAAEGERPGRTAAAPVAQARAGAGEEGLTAAELADFRRRAGREPVSEEPGLSRRAWVDEEGVGRYEDVGLDLPGGEGQSRKWFLSREATQRFGVTAPVGPEEPERLAAVRRFSRLDEQDRASLNTAAALAAALTDCTQGSVIIVGADTEYFPGRYGHQLTEIHGRIGAGSYVIAEKGPVEIPDLSADTRFAHVVGAFPEMPLRFIAAAPLTTHDGHIIGAVSVGDRIPRQLTPGQRTALQELADQTMRLLEERREAAMLDRVAETVRTLDQFWYADDLATAASTVAEASRELLQADEVTTMMPDLPASAVFQVVATSAAPGVEASLRPGIRYSFTSAPFAGLLRGQDPLFVSDAAGSGLIPAPMIEEGQIGSLYAVPLPGEGGVAGLALARWAEPVHEIDPTALRAMDLLRGQAGHTIARLRASQDRAREAGLDPTIGLTTRSAFLSVLQGLPAGTVICLLAVGAGRADGQEDRSGRTPAERARMLRCFAMHLRQVSSDHRYLARWSEDRFLMAVPVGGIRAAEAGVERLRRAWECEPMPPFAVGMAVTREEEPPSAALIDAEAALLNALAVVGAGREAGQAEDAGKTAEKSSDEPGDPQVGDLQNAAPRPARLIRAGPSSRR